MYQGRIRCDKNGKKWGNNSMDARVGLAGAGLGVIRGLGVVLGVFW